MQHPPVDDSARHAFEEPIMRKTSEIVGEIHVDYLGASGIDEVMHFLNRLQGIPTSIPGHIGFTAV
jgi:hypothetical protein